MAEHKLFIQEAGFNSYYHMVPETWQMQILSTNLGVAPWALPEYGPKTGGKGGVMKLNLYLESFK